MLNVFREDVLVWKVSEETRNKRKEQIKKLRDFCKTGDYSKLRPAPSPSAPIVNQSP